jgi:hypothetical protein
MITPSDIYKNGRKLFPKVLLAHLQDEDIFPLSVKTASLTKFNRLPLLERGKILAPLIASGENGSAYELTFAEVQTRKEGLQSHLKGISFPNLEAYLQFTQQKTAFATFTQNVELVRSSLPQLENWMHLYPPQMVKYPGEWSDIILICNYFLKNPRPNLYIRELPIPIHTKFIEQHKDILGRLLTELLPAEVIMDTANSFEERFHLRKSPSLCRIRLLDHRLAESFFSGITDISMLVEEAAKLSLPVKRVFIIENLMTFLTLPPQPDACAIFGKGFQAQQVKQLEWLHQCEIWYWGDMDAHGFEILSQVRGYFPHVQSMLMDRDTYDKFKRYSVKGTDAIQKDLSNLSEKERELYAYLFTQSGHSRLEQEHISQEWVEWFLGEI